MTAAIAVPGLPNLSNTEKWYLNWIKLYTVPNLKGVSIASNAVVASNLDKATRCHRAAVVAWYALKEGIYGDFNQQQLTKIGMTPYSNVFGYSLCLYSAWCSGGSAQCPISPYSVCPRTTSGAWQLGLAGCQYGDFDGNLVNGAALKIYTLVRSASVSYATVLDTTLTSAGFMPRDTTKLGSDLNGGVYNWVMKPSNLNTDTAVRRSWLLRNHLVGFALNWQWGRGGLSLQVCYTGSSSSDCRANNMYARDFTAVKSTIDKLDSYFCS